MRPDDRTDAEIIRKALDDPTEFGEIFARHHDAIFGYVARRIGAGDAGDVAADVFVRAFSIRHRYDLDHANCVPWLYGIAINILGDRHRRIRRRESIPWAAIRPDVESGEWRVDDRLVAEQVRARLDEALIRLARKDRETLALFALEGLTYAEIAEALSIPVGTVGSRIFRARQRILELIPDLRQIADVEPPPGNENRS